MARAGISSVWPGSLQTRGNRSKPHACSVPLIPGCAPAYQIIPVFHDEMGPDIFSEEEVLPSPNKDVSGRVP
jgi:hypothetical protein